MKNRLNKALFAFIAFVLFFEVNFKFIIAVTKNGDINNDGVLTKEDALLIVEKTINGTITQEDIDIADLNNDGVLNVLDAQMLMKEIDPTFKIGDYNKDGKISMSDGFSVLKIDMLIIEFESFESQCEITLYCDINGDGNLRMYDAMKILVMAETGNMNEDVNLDKTDALIIVDRVINNNATDNEISKGDVDGDGELTINDAQEFMKKYYNGTFVLGDYNHDEILNMDDTQQLLQYLANYHNGSKEPEVVLYCDMNNDAIVDINDVYEIMSSIPKKGDLDRDGVVNANDAAVALDLYKYNNATKNDIYIGDIDENSVINANDAALILDIYKYGE